MPAFNNLKFWDIALLKTIGFVMWECQMHAVCYQIKFNTEKKRKVLLSKLLAILYYNINIIVKGRKLLLWDAAPGFTTSMIFSLRCTWRLNWSVNQANCLSVPRTRRNSSKGLILHARNKKITSEDLAIRLMTTLNLSLSQADTSKSVNCLSSVQFYFMFSMAV